MTESQKSIIKEYTETLFSSYGLELRRPNHCIDPEHRDSEPSMTYYSAGKYLKCWGCDKSYDIFSILAIKENITNFNDQVNYLIDRFDINLPKFNNDKPKPVEENIILLNSKFREYREELQGNNVPLDYLKARGITRPEILETLGYDKMSNSIIIPTKPSNDNTGYTAYTQRFIENSKMRYKNNGTPGLFNSKALGDNNGSAVFIVEGYIDALSIKELGFNAVAIGSTNNLDKLTDALIEYKDKITVTDFIIAFDNDTAGEKANKKMLELLQERKIKSIIAHNLYSKYKDANEFLVNDKEKFKEKLDKYSIMFDKYLNQEKEEYRTQNSIKGYLDIFLKNTKDNYNYKPIPTGFNVLDNALNGGLYPSLYVIGAISSLGKTTLALQLGEQIAQQYDKDILVFSMEMGKDELIAKSLSRKMFEISAQDNNDYKVGSDTMYTLDILQNKTYTDSQRNLLNKALEEYTSYSSRIYIYEAEDGLTGEKIKEIINNHIYKTGRKPIVFIDYLQIIPKEKDSRLTDKQLADANVSMLKRVARDYTTPVFVISSLNRGSYNERVTMASFKESGGIEYGCDVLLGLNLAGLTYYDDKSGKYKNADAETVENLKRNNPRRLELNILKNRNGETGISVNLKYYTNYNCFIEDYIK